MANDITADQVQDFLTNPDALEISVDVANAKPLPEPLQLKKYARFHPDSQIQIETRQAVETPTDNASDGSVWHEVDDYFVEGKHMILDEKTNSPRHMTDGEHVQWWTEVTTAAALTHARNHRKVLLNSTDWVETAPMDADKKKAWQDYRQALRDLPTTITDHNIDWPTPPEVDPSINHNPGGMVPPPFATGPVLNATNTSGNNN